MSIAKVTEITASSVRGFEDAIRNGITRAARTIGGMQFAWVNRNDKEAQDVVRESTRRSA